MTFQYSADNDALNRHRLGIKLLLSKDSKFYSIQVYILD